MSSNFYQSSILPYAAIISKICRAYTHTQADFEDYYQEVCLQIWKSKDRFKEKSEWSTWIYKLTLNVCLTLQKKKKLATKPLDYQEAKLLKTDRDTTKEDERLADLYDAIRQLSKIDRAVILLYLEEKSYQEIADILGTNSINIGVRINRIKKRLKKLLSGKIN